MSQLGRLALSFCIVALVTGCGRQDESGVKPVSKSAEAEVKRESSAAVAQEASLGLKKESKSKIESEDFEKLLPGSGSGSQMAKPAAASEKEKETAAKELEPEAKPVMKAVPVSSDPLDVFEAVRVGDEALLATLLEAGLPAEQLNAEADTPLCMALRARKLSMAVKLLAHGASPHTPGRDRQAPLALASFYRHPTLFEDLLKAGADANVTFNHPVDEKLLKMVPDPWLCKELKRERNVTPLMACSIRGDVEGVITLLKYGARKNAYTLPSHRYAINMAADHKYLFIMRVLLGRDPDEEPPRLITVDLSDQKFWVQQQGEEILRSSISSGRSGKETPSGRYVITNKHKDWTSTIYKVSMPYFLRFNCSEIGFHSGRVTGRPASAGCVRLPNAMAKKMFDLAQVGDEVIIQP